MAWTFRGDRPIYMQIASGIKRQIFSGKYGPGDRIPGVRELAVDISANPNTIQHAMNILEEEGLLVTQSTAGRFVTDDPKTIERLRMVEARRVCEEMIDSLKPIGLDKDEIFSIIRETLD